ncbi:hypothetical protein SAMN05444285_1339 [Draconibacterium orientale]|uniref:Uncharacterized protein n=1 Tax=Draconibacterium orientale TaxID=1168034 RepID=A0A1I0ILG7_9BACT|nr:hypothetical protein SAMN05444285_1339 [Draconibacterium orientale]
MGSYELVIAVVLHRSSSSFTKGGGPSANGSELKIGDEE